MRTIFITLFISLICLYSCSDRTPDKKSNETGIIKQDSVSVKKETTNQDSIPRLQRNFTLKDFYTDNHDLSILIDSLFDKLSDEERIGQMIVTSSGSLGKSKQFVAELIKQKKAGGVLLLGGSKESFTELISFLKKTADSSKCLPLIFSTDAEPSLINLKISGIKKFNPTISIKNESESYKTASDISKVIKLIGFNQNYAPVCDLSFNKEIINNRSFGTDEKRVISLSSAFINATQEQNIIATAKHFPGHGNVSGDSHKEDVTIKGELKELNVFKEVIRAGVISVMVGHIIISDSGKYSTQGLPATLSKRIVTDLLKNELGFKGIIITDGMNMKAVTKYESPSLKAVLAGCDMILMPSDETKLIISVKNEIDKNNEIRAQIYESVKKIIRAKICLGLI